MLDVIEQYWRKRDFDFIADLYDHQTQFAIAVTRGNDVAHAVRLKMQNPPFPTNGEVLSLHHKLLVRLPEEAMSG